MLNPPDKSRYTGAMKLSAFVARHRLLTCLCALSLLLHLAALTWIDLRLDWLDDRADAGAPAPLVLRLPADAPPASAPAIEAPVFPPQAVMAFAPAPLQASNPDPAPPAMEQANAPAPVDMARAPGVYNSSPSGSVRIGYRLTHAAPGASARDEGAARLAWNTDGSSYRLEMDGVLGELRSEGGLDDHGIAPVRAREALGTGHATTLFDRATGTISNALGLWRTPLLAGSQDSATVLLQLGGMGRSRDTQLLSEVRLLVAGAAGARIERYETVGQETIDTGIGALETVHLQRLGAPDAPRLDLWLAPAHAWLPVQLRLTWPDGAVRTQTVATIEQVAPGDG